VRLRPVPHEYKSTAWLLNQPAMYIPRYITHHFMQYCIIFLRGLRSQFRTQSRLRHCSSAGVYQHFRGSCCLHLQVRSDQNVTQLGYQEMWSLKTGGGGGGVRRNTPVQANKKGIIEIWEPSLLQVVRRESRLLKAMRWHGQCHSKPHDDAKTHMDLWASTVGLCKTNITKHHTKVPVQSIKINSKRPVVRE
jgi:hypothetical protein